MNLYVHVPFCKRRCRYCDFVSTEGLPRQWQARYRQALLAEWDLYLAEWNSYEETGLAAPEETLYFGGGTPTYLDEDILTGMIGDILSRLPRPPLEFTVEANPGTLTPGKLRALKEAGCNRLSIGAQSFDDAGLAWLGRSHSAADFREAWAAGRAAGFANMNLDLMYGLPGQKAAHWRETLAAALRFRPEHISLYQLQIEPETALGRLAAAGMSCAADEESCRRQYLLAHRMLTGAGYLHYEISNYALPGRESRHNTVYWRNGGYLGLGAGAAGYLRGRRYTNKADLTAYFADVEKGKYPRAEEEEIDGSLAQAEEMMLAFRLEEGVDAAGFLARWGLTPRERYGQAVAAHLAAKRLEERGGRLRPTVEGWLSYNSWITDFLP